MQEFSLGQIARMQAVLLEARPELVASSAVPTPLRPSPSPPPPLYQRLTGALRDRPGPPPLRRHVRLPVRKPKKRRTATPARKVQPAAPAVR